MRGTVLFGMKCWKILRITPACAGNRESFAEQAKWEKDHPRVCGEQFTLGAGSTGFAGSPPRVRGTGGDKAPVREATRITPACAGNSPADRAEGGNQQDHPRVCGEQGFA